MSIGRKFALWVLSILLVAGVITGYLFYRVEMRDEEKKIELFGRLSGRVVEESLITYMRNRDNAGLNLKLEGVKESTGIITRILLLNRDGVVKAGTEKDLTGKRFSIRDEGCRECHEKGHRGVLMNGSSSYRWAAPVENKPACHGCHNPRIRNNGLLIIDFSVPEFLGHVREELRNGFIVIVAAMSMVGAIIVILSNRLVGRRLERMAGRMKKFQEGDVAVRAAVEGNDEITKLEAGFNELVQAVASHDRQQDELVGKINEQLQFLQLLMDTIPMPVFYKDVQGVYRGCNKAFEAYLGRPKEDIIGMTVYDLAPRELADKYHEMDKSLFEKPGIQVYEYSVKNADGAVRVVIFNKATYSDAQGDVAGLLGVMQDITERKRLEQKLAQSESRLRTIIDTEPECVKVIAADGSLLEMNPAGLAMIEADSFDQVTGERIFSLIVPEFRDAFEELSRKTFRGESGTLEFEIIGLKGTRRWLETHTAPLRNAQGKIFALLGLTRDISERKRAEQLIRRNYDAQTAINWILHISLEDIPLDSILKQTLDLILSIPWLSIESKGSIFLVEGAPDKLVMKAQRGLSDYLRVECAVVPFGKCLCGRAAARGEVQFSDSLDDRHEISYDGMSGHGHYCVPIMFGQTVLGVINLYLKEGHLRDDKEVEFLNAVASAMAGIIRRKRAEEEREKLFAELQNTFEVVSRSHKQWKDTFDSITDMIWIVDTEFRIMKANMAFSSYYGFAPREVINKKCYQIVHEMDHPFPACPHGKTISEKHQSEDEVFDKRTKKTFRIFTFPFNSPGGETIGSIHIARDITDDKEKEMRLIMSERLAGLGQLASGIAHEINNPLASIAGCSEGLLSRVRKGQFETPLFESYLGIIQEEVFRCKSITTSMLSFVRKTTYEKKDINVNELLDKTLEIIGFQGRFKSVEIVKRYRPQPPVVHANEGELRQVFLAIITNALDAMDDNGVLTLETDAIAPLPPSEQGGEGSSIIRISDTGAGIPPEIMTRIFDPFFTTKSERGGTGLGLSIARKIVMNHNGNIDAVSETDKGTTITITLPS